MLKWIFAAMSLVFILSLVVILKFGTQPKSIPIVKWNQFTEIDFIAKRISQRFYQELREARLVVLGFDKRVSLETQVGVWNQFLAHTDQTKFQFFVHKTVGKEVVDSLVKQGASSPIKFEEISEVKTWISSNGTEKALIIGPSELAYGGIVGSWGKQLVRGSSKALYSLVTTTLNSGQSLSVKCEGRRLLDLNCFSNKVSSKYRRKAWGVEKRHLALEQVGTGEYVLLLGDAAP